MLIPTLAACGGGGDKDKADPTTLSVAVDVTKTEVNIIEKLIDGFNATGEGKDVKVRVV